MVTDSLLDQCQGHDRSADLTFDRENGTPGGRLPALDKRAEADEMARQVEHVELAAEPNFEKVFSQAMWFPHAKDSFPHLKHLLLNKIAK